MTIEKNIQPTDSFSNMKTKELMNPKSPLGIFGRYFHWIIFFLTAFSVFIFQSYLLGFQKGHHGWVSAHNLSLISKTTVDNRFVSYTLSFQNNGEVTYRYFRRGPFVLPLFQRLATMAFTKDLSTQIFLNRQFMNLVFIGCMWVAFLILKKMNFYDPHAMTVVTLSFSGFYMMKYKDMIAVDLISVLGFLLIILGVLHYSETLKRTRLYVLSAIAVSIGWGISVLPLLGGWFLIEFILMLRQDKLNPKALIKRLFALESFRLLFFSFIVCFSFVVYNIHMESKMTDLPWHKTGVFETAKKRLGADPKFQKKHMDVLNWNVFTKSQIKRIEKSLYPYKLIKKLSLGPARYAVYLLFLGLFIAAVLKWNKGQKVAACLLLGSGFCWLFSMRNLAAFHDYTAMAYIGVSLVFYGSYVFFIPKKAGPFILILAFSVFTAANLLSNMDKNKMAVSVNPLVADFQNISEITEPGSAIYYDQGYRNVFPGAPYAVGYLLSLQHIAKDKKDAGHIISRDKKYNANNLTKRNNTLFLFKKDE